MAFRLRGLKDAWPRVITGKKLLAFVSHGSTVRTADHSALRGLGETMPTPANRAVALATCLALVGVALAAGGFGGVQAPKVPAFIPITATVWALADLMTAFLLLAQFYVNGTTFFTVLAAAYALSGLLTLPYVFAFPGVLSAVPPSLPEQQVSIWFWVIWHSTFPLIVIVSLVCDPGLNQRVRSRERTRNAVWIAVLATVSCAGVFTACIFANRAGLPLLVVSGHLQWLFNHICSPAIAVLNLIGCCLLLRRARTLTTLHVWLFVALFTAMLDGLLNMVSPSRYSYGWYVGKLETVTTASVVLIMLLSEVTGLYRRLAQMATVDPLTDSSTGARSKTIYSS